MRSEIGTEIPLFSKSFQEGRVPDFGTAVPKNEREVTTFDFVIGFDNVSYHNRISGKHKHE